MTTKPTPSAHAIADVDPTILQKRAALIEKHLDAIDELMVDGVELTDAQRRVALRLLGPQEAEALTGVLDFADARPELFKDLANEDEGNDPTVFETKLLRGRLANASTLTGLASRIDTLHTTLSDSALYAATLAKKPTLAAYEIAKPYQARDKEHGKMLNAAVNLYRAHSLAGARTKAANKAIASAAKAGPTEPAK
jgi:hypothetical protein